jgi:hypothetical protein
VDDDGRQESGKTSRAIFNLAAELDPSRARPRVRAHVAANFRNFRARVARPKRGASLHALHSRLSRVRACARVGL